MIWPAQELIEQGRDIIFRQEIQAKFMEMPDGNAKIIGVKIPDDADVVVLQRPLQHDIVKAIPALQENGVAVVVEVDDDFAHIHPQNAAFIRCHPKFDPRRNWHLLNEAIKSADLVTVSTPRLAEIYGKGKNVILSNCVQDWYFDIEPQERHGIGWSGSIATHPGDLEVTRGAMGQVCEPFRVIGTGNGVKDALGLSYEPQSSGWLDINGDYQREVSTLKVGIVPLVDSVFNQSKSWIKGLEYAALGVPFIASPTEEYLGLHDLGAGLLAKRPKDWVRHVNRLLSDETYWYEISEAGKEVARQFTYQKRAHLWFEAWERARANRAQRIVDGLIYA